MAKVQTGLAFDWQEATPGTWERKLDEAETFYASLQKQFEGTGRKFFAITGHITINVCGNLTDTLTEEEFDAALERSWLKLRNTHPSIAVETDFDETDRCLKKNYITAGETYHANWLRQTFHIIPDERSGIEWCNTDPPAPDIASLFVLNPSPSQTSFRRDLVFRSPHDVVDGIGTLQILGVYVRHLSESLISPKNQSAMDWTDEYLKLTPPLRIAANLPDELRNAVEVALTEAHRKSTELISQGSPVMIVPCSKKSEIPAAHQRVALRLDQSTTSTIIQACKSASVSVTHAYHAAAAIVLARRQKRSENEQQMQHVSYALVNLREQCQSPYNGTDHAASVYHCTSAEKFGIKFTIPKIGAHPPIILSDFERVLAEIKDYYVANRPSTEPMLLKIAPLLWQQATPYIPDEAWAKPYVLPVPPPNASPTISMSSFGIIDKLIPTQIGDVSVYNPWVTGEELGPGIGLFLGTFRGELEISAAYNAAWHNLDELREYLDEIHQTVRDGFDKSPK